MKDPREMCWSATAVPPRNSYLLFIYPQPGILYIDYFDLL